MKKLITLLFAGLITVNAFGFETDRFKYVPKGEDVILLDMNENGRYDFVWWDKNRDEVMQNDERFYDLNEDGIPDISHEEVIKMYENNKRILEKSI